MMKKIILFFIFCFFGIESFAQGWLPEHQDRFKKYRLLDCSYEQSNLKKASTIYANSENWAVQIDSSIIAVKGLVTYVFTFKAKRAMDDAGVAVAFDEYDWSSDNFVLIPAVVYNGNRQRIVNREYATGLDKTDYYRKDLALTSNPIPQLSPEYGANSRLEVNISNTSTPNISYLKRNQKKGTLLFTEQGINWQGEIKDHALIVEESLDRQMASFVISAPGVREKKPEFIGFSKSPDRGIKVEAGTEIVIRVNRVTFECVDIPSFYYRFMEERKLHLPKTETRNLIPMSAVFDKMTKNIEERYYSDAEVGFYCPENANWMSYGWVGGLINTYPMLAMNRKEEFEKVANTFNFALMNGRGASGYYYDVLGSDKKIVFRDAAKLFPGIGLTRKNADVLYWMVKQFMLIEKQGKGKSIEADWKSNVKQLADAFVQTWREQGTWGNYLDIEKGVIAVYNTTGGASAVSGLALASQYYNDPTYLKIAKEAANNYYKSFELTGFTSGACGDILQNADSETAIALTTSMMTLYEVTGDKDYLEKAQRLADYTASWTVSFPYELPKNTALGKLNANLTGAVWASTQNKHGAPGFCTQSGDVLFKLFRETQNPLYAEFMRDVIHAHAEGIQPNGKITERLTYCDADSRGSRGDGGKTGWNETNGALMAIEIPGIYIRTDLGKIYAFDHVVVKSFKKKRKGWELVLNNPTTYEAKVSVLAEDKKQAEKPLGENAGLDWGRKVVVPAGQTITISI